MLQVIKAEEVRDGEPRWWCPDDVYAARTLEWIVTGNLHTEWRREADAFTLAIVDRPAPTPTPAPGLDLDAVERAERVMTPGPWRADFADVAGPDFTVATCIGPDAEHDAAGIVALRNAAPALIAEVRALRAVLAEVSDLIGNTEHESTCAIGPYSAEQNGADCSCTVGAIAAALEAL